MPSQFPVVFAMSLLANILLGCLFISAPMFASFVRLKKRESFVKRLCYAEDLSALEAAITGAPGILIIANSCQVITHASRETAKILGIPHSDLIGRNLSSVYPNKCCCLSKSEVATSTNGEFTVILGQRNPE